MNNISDICKIMHKLVVRKFPETDDDEENSEFWIELPDNTNNYSYYFICKLCLAQVHVPLVSLINSLIVEHAIVHIKEHNLLALL